MNPVRAAAAVSLLGLALLGVDLVVAQELPPPAPPGPTAAPLPTGAAPPELPIPEGTVGPQPPPPGIALTAPAQPAPERVLVPVTPPPVAEERPKTPALPPAFRLLTNDSALPTRPAQAPAGWRDLPAPPPGSAGPSLLVEKRGPVTVPLGQTLVYEVIVRNAGSLPAAQVHVQDEVPAGTRLLNTTPPAAVRGQHLVWLIDTLPRGTEARFRVELQALAAGEVSTRASVGYLSNEIRTVIQGTGLGLSVLGPDTAAVGQVVVLKINIANQQVQPLRKLALVCRVPEGLQHPMGKEIEADLGELEAGQSKSVDLKLTAVAAGRFVSEIFMTAEGGLEASAHAAVTVLGAAPPESTPVAPPPIAPAAAVQPAGPLVVRKTGQQRLVQGQLAEYRLEVLNRGDTEATNVVLQDQLPVGLEFAAGSKGVTYNAASRTVVWAAGGVEAHQAVTAAIKLTPRGTGEMINLVTVQADNRPDARLTATLNVVGRFPPAFALPTLPGKKN